MADPDEERWSGDIPREEAEALGRDLAASTHMAGSRRLENDSRDQARYVLGYGAPGLTDDTVWIAVTTAIDLVRDETQMWHLGEGVIDETIRTRPELARRWRALYMSGHQMVRDIHRVMEDYSLRFYERRWWPDVSDGRS